MILNAPAVWEPWYNSSNIFMQYSTGLFVERGIGVIQGIQIASEVQINGN